MIGFTLEHLFLLQDCGLKYHIEHGYAHFEGHETTYGSQVPVSCNDGYTLEGDNFTVCQNDGRWSLNTACHAVDCGTNYTIPNGHAHFAGHNTTYDSKVPIHCDGHSGYLVEGDAFVTCLSNGEWSETSHCVIKDCGAHYVLENGHVNITGRETTYGEKIQVACNEGYHLVGQEFTECQFPGWTKDTGCQRKDCGSPNSVTNGYAAAVGGTTFNHTAHVTCSEGYENKGDTYITCQADGQWSSHNACHIIECDAHHHIEHGHIDFSGWSTIYDSIVPFTCDPGYETDTHQFIHCMSNGNWSTVSCRPKDCKASFHLEHGHVDFVGDDTRDTTFGSTIPVMCNEGYEIQGHDHIQCGEDGIWMGFVACRPKDCGTNYTLEHGYANFERMETTYGAMVPVSCIDGYEIDGHDHITCQANKTWTTTTCKIKDCGSHYHLDNGHVDFTGKETTYGERIHVMCYVGHYIEGDEYITCLADGSWSNNSACLIHDCGKQYDLDDGKAHFTNDPTTYNHTLQLECNEGHNLHGDEYAVCLSNGTWSRTAQCIIKDCGTVYYLEHGSVNFVSEETTFNSTIPVDCDLGYEIHGDPEITCLDDGWSNTTSCDIIDCGTSFLIEHGHANFTDRLTTYNESIPVICAEGYVINGEHHHTTCLANGSWAQLTFCVPIDCGSSYPLDHGHLNFTGWDTTFNHSVPISCYEGYEANADHHITCLENGTWGGHVTCVLKDCGDSYTIEHGHVNFTGHLTTFNQTVPVVCNVGYNLVGASNIACGSDGSWSTDTHCQAVDCGTEYTLEHGHVNFTSRDTTYGQTVQVSCNLGYGIHGTEHITCQTNGSWGGDGHCLIKDCGDTYTLNNGYVNFTGHATTYNEEVPVMCNEGYEIEGDPKIKCLATGAWSQDTACRAKPAEVEEDNTGVIVGATVGGVAAVALTSAIVVAIIQKRGLLCFGKSYSLGHGAINSTPVPPKTVY